ncbi:hypothetical protein AQUCO_01800228v1 [Aquilegia coerulea]|uniref:hAT-like transposase RNase-H fold domain-containing protein n=1 Tax=Aquilegia coerulea TaxID=218851 RepID=A0A2G5DL89_AQUCA|nr:hypothetical protein AQUCO_01800228v1 [Aquilegia coerulea]
MITGTSVPPNPTVEATNGAERKLRLEVWLHFDKEKSQEAFKFDQMRSRLDLARIIIKHEYPFTMVDYEYFRVFINNLRPLLNLVTKNTIKSHILSVYKEEREKLYKFFDEFSGRVSFTTDLWTSETRDAYLCLTAHFKDTDWVRTISVDNASSNDVMVNNIKDILNGDGLLVLGGQFLHVRCTTHILNLIVKDGLSVIGNVLSNIRESCKFVKATPQRKLKWKSTIEQVKVSSTQQICLDVPRRWNSTFKMLERALIYKGAFFRLEQREESFMTNPSKEDWEIAKVICNCLKIFYDSTNTLSGTEYPTANIYFAEVCEIHLNLFQWCKHENQWVVMMAEKMYEKFKKYWSVCSLILAVAVVLDPRFKMRFVQYYFNLIYGLHEAEIYINKVQILLEDLYSEYDSKSNLNSGTSHSPSSLNLLSGESSNMDKIKKFETWCMKEGYESVTKKYELEQYLVEPIFPADCAFNILNWWKLNTPNVLTIPISTVASESAFSTSGRVLNEYRSSLTPNTLHVLICAQNWLKSSKGITS